MDVQIGEEITQLEMMRDSHVLVYIADDRSMFTKGIATEDISPMYECLRELGKVDRLDLVLYSGGGNVAAARRMCLLLRGMSQELHVFVPYKARSAGTLLCLGADSIHMGTLAELSPIDPYLHAQSEVSTGTPSAISSADVRAFKLLAESWFGLHGADQTLQVFRLLCERVFPTTLSAFFRAEANMRQIACELLAYQLPHLDSATRQQIVERLLNGYEAHDYTILCEEAQQIGLQAHSPRPSEEELIWTIWQKCKQALDSSLCPDNSGCSSRINGFIVTMNRTARHVVRWSDGTQPGSVQNIGNGQSQRTLTAVLEAKWEL